LRERRDDIPLLLSYFLYQYSQRHGRQIRGFTQNAVRLLLSYQYPGNIRELQNLVERGVIAAEEYGMVDLNHIFRNEEISLDSLYSLDRDGGLTTHDKAGVENTNAHYLDLLKLDKKDQPSITLEALESKIIDEAVTHTKGNLASAARMLGLSRAQLAYRLEKSARSKEIE
jgi:transcriptional regulator with AAA-type ATPase domain